MRTKRLPLLLLTVAPWTCLLAQDPPAVDHGRAPDSVPAFDTALEGLWTVDNDGRTVLAPDPWADGDTPGFLFDNAYLPGQTLFQAGLANMGSLYGTLALCPGGQDLASLCDAENHFRRLGMAVNAPGLRAVITAARPARDRQDPAVSDARARRTELDRILAIGLARLHGHRALLEPIAAIADDAEADPILRRAAVEAAAALRGEPTPEWSWELPSLEERLAGLPNDTAALMVYQLDDAPHMGPVIAASRRGHAAALLPDLEAMQTAELRPRAYTPREAAKLAVIADMPRELGYELARRYDNLRVRRIVFAFGPLPERGDEQSITLVVDGLFEVDAMARAARRAGSEISVDQGVLSCALTEGCDLRVGPRSLTLTVSTPAPSADSPPLLDRLGDHRPDPEDLYWAWSDAHAATSGSSEIPARPSSLLPPVPTETPFPVPVESVLSLRLERGVDYRAVARFESNAAAGQYQTACREWLAGFEAFLPAQGPGWLRELVAGTSISVEGSRCELEIRAADLDVMAAFVEWMHPPRLR